ncbi:TPA: hypothetical protein L3N15_004175 [Vibrio parahaemolyticus]|nr:hypothetical protein [Vibrio parahaemolyticus]
MNELEVQELAGEVLGLTEEQIEAVQNDDEDLDAPLMDKFGVDFEQFKKIAEALIVFAPPLKSAITEQWDHCFVKQVPAGYLAIAKTPVKERSNG